jgi:hypothetical protein
MNIQLCGSLFNLDVNSLCGCFGESKTGQEQTVNAFTLVIDKRISNYPFVLDTENNRVSILDATMRFLNNPNFDTKLPPIFTTRTIVGKPLSEVIHEDIAPFYQNFVSSTFQEKTNLKLHVILNGTHILLTTYPYFDNKSKMIGCTLTEIPFLKVPDFGERQDTTFTRETASP